MSALLEGQKFVRCRIHRYLGDGISGESYEAEDIVLQRKVTLKLIHPWSPLSEASRRQFFREMQDISRIEHAFLAAILDYGEYNGQLFIARRYVGPGSLLSEEGHYWYRPPLAVPTAIHLAHQLAQALHTIHLRGYAHGSLTMTNIQILRGPQPGDEQSLSPFLITDVGLAYFAQRFGKRQTTFLPATAAPEQMGGRTIAASDQYALAVILYFWLTGLLPFVGSPDTIEQQKLSEHFTSPEELNAQVTPTQARSIQQALSVYPEDRYPSISAFTSALEATLSQTDRTASEFQPVASSQLTDSPAILQSRQASFPIEQLPKTPAPSLDTIPGIPSTPLPLASSWAEQEPAISQQISSMPPIVKPAITTDNGARMERHDHIEEILSALAGRSPELVFPPLPLSSTIHPEQVQSEAHRDIRSLSTGAVSAPDVQEPGQGSVYLVITSHSNSIPYKVKLEEEEITIGRAGSSHILLDQDTLTSRHQAMLKYEQGKYVLYDLRSAYGTTVNGQQLSSGQGYMLQDGDRIGIGSYELVFTRKAL